MISNKVAYSPKSVGTILLLIGLICNGTTIAQTPVAHWTFDEGLTNLDLTTVPDAANSNDAVWQGSEVSNFNYIAGQIGGAIKLNGGTNEYFSVNGIPQIDGIEPTPLSGSPVLGVGITFSAWVNINEDADSNRTHGILMGRVTDEDAGGPGTNQVWGLAYRGTDFVDTRISNNDGPDGNPESIVRGQWHHVAMVWGNVDAQASPIPPALLLYVDGVLQDEVEPNSDVYYLADSGTWFLGDDTCCSGRELDGALDDLAVFASALSGEEIRSLYNDGLVGIDASGQNTGLLATGDVDGMNGVDLADFGIIRDNLGRSATSRSIGDISGSRRVDLDDLRLWLDSAPSELRAQAIASMTQAVPEPSGVLLAVLMSCPYCLTRLRSLRF